MLHINDIEGKDLLFIKHAFITWFALAGILLPVVSLILHCCMAEYAVVSYSSSALSFICSVGAGIIAQRDRGGGAIYTGLLVGTMLCIFLLTVGFLICDGRIQSDGIISVASFTITGALVGSVLCSQRWAKRGPKSREKNRKKGINIIRKNNN